MQNVPYILMNIYSWKFQTNLEKEAYKYNNQYDYSLHPDVIISKMKFKCKHCQALKFKDESKGLCCKNGQVILPKLLDPPKQLIEYVSGDSDTSLHFLRNIRKYNSNFQMTSFGASKMLNKDQYLPTFEIQGIYHQVYKNNYET